MTEPALRSILVAGGGITALAAAAALKRRAPFLDVTLLATAPAPDALADRITCTLPSLTGFHADLGLGEEDAVVRTGAGYRLGTIFSGWAEGLPDYVHAYGRYGQPFGATSFHLHWIRAAREGAVAPFDTFSPAAALARADRFVPPTPNSPFAEHEYGLTLDLSRYAAMLRAFARHVGVREMEGAIGNVTVADERITAIRLQDGRTLGAGLYVDATGPAAQLRGAIDDARDDWSRWLPCDRVLLAETATPPAVLTEVTAHATGWRWSSGTQAGFAYASAHLSDGKAARALRNACGSDPGEPIRVRPGTRPQPWRGNCIAIGDAATEVEPLEWCNLHLALSAIDRLITMLPAATPSAVEAADFNRQTLAEANRVRDLLAMHYATARRADPMWRALAVAEPPPGLSLTLTQWSERGRLPYFEEETFTRDSWAAVLLGQGAMPRRVDPLTDAVPLAQAEATMRRLAAAIAQAVPQTPTHAAYLAAQRSRATSMKSGR